MTATLTIEHRIALTDPEPAHIIRYPRAIFPMPTTSFRGQIDPELMPWIAAAWYEDFTAETSAPANPTRRRHFLLTLPIGPDTPFPCPTNIGCTDQHSWNCVLFDNARGGHGLDVEGWVLMDASLYFLYEGANLATVPMTHLPSSCTPRAIADCLRAGGPHVDGAPTGYGVLLTPPVESRSEDSYCDNFGGDFRSGMSYGDGSTYLATNGRVHTTLSGGSQSAAPLSNWRVIVGPCNTDGTTPVVPESDPDVPDTITMPVDEVTGARIAAVIDQGLSVGSVNTLKAYLKEQTLAHEGCNEGKTAFLRGTGLFDEDELSALFVSSWDVYWATTVRGIQTVEAASAEEARIKVRDQDYSDDDEMIVDAVRETTPGITIGSVMPSD